MTLYTDMQIRLREMCRTDTIFLASCYYGDLEAGDGVVGCDVSHRGGPPGFVQVSGPGTLRFADYIGNFTFTTLGEPCSEYFKIQKAVWAPYMHDIYKLVWGRVESIESALRHLDVEMSH